MNPRFTARIVAIPLAILLGIASATAIGVTPGANTPSATPEIAASWPELKPTPVEARAAHVAAEVLARFHYTPKPPDASLSARVFDQYLKLLDSEKLLFVQQDIDRMAVNRAQIGEAVMKEDLSLPFAMYNLYRQRAAERFAYARGLLKAGFDFSTNETYQFARAKAGWAQGEAEMRELWRKRLKNDWLLLKIGGKDDKAIAETLDKRYDALFRQVARAKSSDAMQAFMNAYATAIEPHTSYLGPRAAEDFGISMQLSLVGIGASLSEVDEFITIRELIAGGPALLSGQLKAGDRILGVGQGESGPITDVFGWRVDDAVQLIRGAQDSTVRLEILPAEAAPGGQRKLVTLVRKTISLEAGAAKAAVHPVTQGGKTWRVGVISLPTFYEDFAARNKGATDYRSATRDVAKLLEGLKKDKVDAVLVDLRNNGGGSMQEAIELTGMFIDQGPVVQQRNANGQVALGSDIRPGTVWDGPMGVLINRRSASSSEIFSAAIQDYGRGVIIGEPSFGKGTVQTLVNLDKVSGGKGLPLGELKLTIAQFFRINGSAMQLRGVTPDVRFPSAPDAETVGESTFENALPWAEIKPAAYAPAGDLRAVLPALVNSHEERMRRDKAFEYLLEDIAESKLLRTRNLVTLNEASRRKEIADREARVAARDSTKSDNEKLQKRLGDPPKDILLLEAVQVLGDVVRSLPPASGLAANAR